jgi:hypothetical protein
MMGRKSLTSGAMQLAPSGKISLAHPLRACLRMSKGYHCSPTHLLISCVYACPIICTPEELMED